MFFEKESVMPAKFLSVCLSLLFIAFAAPVSAAPQILGMVATVEPIPLTCSEGICQAEITTVCLQEHRDAPMPGRAYKAGVGTEITLNILGQSGQQKSIAVSQKISITARRHYTSVVLSMPENALRKFGKGAASISVGALASAVPVPRNSDKTPLTAVEIEKYTGPLREIARTVFEQDNLNVKTTQVLNHLINRLPDGFANDEASFDKSWAALNNKKERKMTPAVKQASSKITETCRYEFNVGVYATMRSCLEQQHDVLASETNDKVWQAMKPGG
jgi:hypothetical protein